MSEFDTVVERRGTDSTKWDKYQDRDVLPFWVADMDFRAPPFITGALRERLDHGIIGYTETPPALVEAVQGNIIADFPVINKSFNLSYSGTDR